MATGPGAHPNAQASAGKNSSSNKTSDSAFDTHTVDNRFAEMQLNSNLVEEAKQLAQEKASSSALTESKVRS